MSGPQWGQPNQPGDPNQPADPNQPQWGQPQQPGYGQPQQPQYGEPQYGQPQYGEPQYGQPQYGEPQYGEPQYGEPQYGEPQYGQPQYGQAPYGQPPYGPPPSGGSGGRKGLLVGAGAVVVAGAVVIILFVTGVFGGDGGGSGSSPSAAVRALLQAAKSRDVSAARDALCTADRQRSATTLTVGADRLTSYTIGKTTQKGATKALVHTTTVAGGKTESADIPTTRQDGTWKVCFSAGVPGGTQGGSSGGSAAASSIPDPSGVPSIAIPSIAVPSIALPSFPTSVPNICTASGLPSGVARFYVTLAQIGSTDSAQRCVYRSTVPRSTTAGLQQTGVFYSLVPGQSDTGSSFVFRSISGSGSIRVTVTKESDGHYYVTGVSKS